MKLKQKTNKKINSYIYVIIIVIFYYSGLIVAFKEGFLGLCLVLTSFALGIEYYYLYAKRENDLK